MTIKLTPSQLQATDPSYPTFVEAGAGSGKTSVLIQRYVSILEANPQTEPRHIVVITFTKDAASELVERLSAQVHSGALSPFTQHKLLRGLSQARITTIHGFCGELIRQFAKHLNVDPEFSILDQTQTQFLVREAISKAIRTLAAAHSPALYYCLSRVALPVFQSHVHWALTHFEEAVRWASASQQRLEDPQAAYFQNLFAIAEAANALFIQLKQSRSLLTFDDLIPLAFSSIQNKDCLAEARSEIHHIMIDEFQDTDPKQWELIKALSDPFNSESKNILGIVGDVKQSIYGFRQANAEQFLTVLNAFLAAPHTRVVRLSENFRTCSTVLSAVNTLFHTVFESEAEHRIPYTPLTASRQTPGSVSLICFSEPDQANAEFQAMATWILNFLRENPTYTYSDIGILMSRSRKFKTIGALFSKAGIPVHFSKQQGLYQKECVVDLYQLITCLMQPYDPLSWVRVIPSPLLGYTFDHIYWLRTAYPGMLPFQAFEAIVSTGQVPDNIPAVIASDLIILSKTGTDWVSHVSFRPISSILRWILDQSNRWEAYRPDETDDMESFLDKVEALEYDCRGNHALFLEQLHQLMQENESEGQAAGTPINAVQVMTIHASKGLEFPIVLIGECGRDMQQKRGRNTVSNAAGVVLSIGTDEPSEIASEVLERDAINRAQESKRLFYVACTRARDHLVFCGTLPKPTKTEKVPLSFFNFLLPQLALEEGSAHFIIKTYDPAPLAYFPTLESIPTAPPVQIPLLSDTRDVAPDLILTTLHTVREPLSERRILRLSVSQAEAGLSCPKKIALFPLIQALSSNKEFALKSPLVSESVHGATIGTDVHLAFHLANRRPDLSPDAILDELGTLSSHDTQFIRHAILDLKTQPFYTYTSSKDALHEFPFQLHIGNLVLDGRLDTAVKIEGRMHIIDYKTDAVSLTTYMAYSQKYYYQLALYAIALELVLGLSEEIVGMLYFTQVQKPVVFSFCKETRKTLIEQLRKLPQHVLKRDFIAPDPAVCQACPYYFVNPDCPKSMAY